MSTPYGIDEHSHRLAAWAASRAASVKGCRFKVQKGVAVLESSGFDPAFSLDNLPAIGAVDTTHAAWRKVVMKHATQNGLTFSHGIAAKLINCYLKVRFVCGGLHEDDRVANLHPPIDDLLLKQLAKKNFGGQAKQWRAFRNSRWSKFDSDTYEEVIVLIRASLPDGSPLWKIEEHWSGHQ